MSENKGTEFKSTDPFYLVQYAQGYTIFVKFYDASVDIHDNRYNDDDAKLLQFSLTDDGQFKVDQKSWKEIVKAYKEGEQGEIKDEKQVKKVDDSGKKTPAKKV